MYQDANKAQDKLDDKRESHWKKVENEEFERIVTEGEAEYHAMIDLMDTAQAEMDRLDADLPNLTRSDDIQNNKNDKRMANSDYTYAKNRSEELL